MQYEVVGLIHMPQDKKQWSATVNTVMNLWVPQTKFLDEVTFPKCLCSVQLVKLRELKTL
jgi:hypothetical protein